MTHCKRCNRPLYFDRDGACRICAYCQHDDVTLDRAPEPGALLRRVRRWLRNTDQDQRGAGEW